MATMKVMGQFSPGSSSDWVMSLSRITLAGRLTVIAPVDADTVIWLAVPVSEVTEASRLDMPVFKRVDELKKWLETAGG